LESAAAVHEEQRARLSRLRGTIEQYGSLLVAFSGGCDSSLLLKVAHEVLGKRVVAVTARSETYPSHEYQDAVEFATALGVRHITIDTSELGVEGFSSNPPNRCYFCKAELFGKLLELAKENDVEYVADGASLDDASDHRPGMRAAAELGVVSPLKEAGLTKDDIREISHELGLPTWDKPSFACLASRFPYGEEITAEKLQMVGEAETYLRNLGFRQLRVRHHGKIARIEVPEADIERFLERSIRENVVAKLRQLGYLYVSLDLRGYRTGSLNEVLSPSERSQESKRESQ
jgi:uncharacterized protein